MSCDSGGTWIQSDSLKINSSPSLVLFVSMGSEYRFELMYNFHSISAEKDSGDMPRNMKNSSEQWSLGAAAELALTYNAFEIPPTRDQVGTAGSYNEEVLLQTLL